MLKPSVQVTLEQGVFVAEFWDCLRLDPAPVQALRREVEQHLGRGLRPDLVVDLLGVGFAGSAALGGFVAIQRLSRAKGGRMIFCNIDLTVFEVFRVSKLDNLFSFAADRASALASLTAPQGDGPVGEAPTPSPTPPRARSGPSAPSRLRRKPRDE